MTDGGNVWRNDSEMILTGESRSAQRETWDTANRSSIC